VTETECGVPFLKSFEESVLPRNETWISACRGE